MYKFYCDTFQMHHRGAYLCLDPRSYDKCTDEEAAAVAVAASDVARGIMVLRTRAEVEQEVKRLLAPPCAEAQP